MDAFVAWKKRCCCDGRQRLQYYEAHLTQKYYMLGRLLLFILIPW
nr:MAG TPA: hypothetical protein [Caudoviricetes sp.]